VTKEDIVRAIGDALDEYWSTLETGCKSLPISEKDEARAGRKLAEAMGMIA